MVTTQNKFQKELQNLFWENKITSDIMKIQQLSFFAELVVEKNKKVNLISRRDIDKIIENHIFISSFIASYVPDKCRNFVDIGTGGGFPGIPLAITKPELKGVLVDSTGKKIDAVREFVDKLKLSNLTVENDRVESNEFIAKHSDQFDLVVSRSSVPLIILFRYALPLIKEKAFIVSVKGGKLDEEFKKAEMKYKAYIKKSTIYDLSYKPSNVRNQKGKKLVLLELQK